MRVFGFGSGMDIDSIVKEIMTAKRAPLDKLKQQKQTFEWQRESYREVNSKLVDFKINKLAKYNKGEEMNPQKAVLTGNSTAISAKANADATPVPMEMYVEQLSTRTTITTTGITGSYANGYKSSTLLSALPGGTSNADAQGNYTLTIGDAEFIFNKDYSITQVLSRINADAGEKKANVVASFDELTGKLILSAKEYGDKQIGAVGGNLLSLFNAAPTDTLSITDGKTGIIHVKSEGEASFQKVEFNGNKTIINGISISLLSTSTEATSSKISVQVEPAKAIESIKSFINDYNELIELMNKKTSEKTYRDFPPLTDEQRKEMSEDDIKNWDAKAKSGLLKNDTILAATVANMREIIYANLGDLSKMGIDTGQYFEGGKLVLKSEDDLNKILENNPTFVTQLFQGSGEQKGIFSQISTKIDGQLQKLVDKVGTSKFSTSVTDVFKTNSIMGDMLKNYNKRIDDMTQRMNDLETRYYKQYAAMEQAMSKYNAQSTSLTNFISG
ncbi:flagellar filament capping protein FliD [Paenibacillus sp. FSL R7-0163]|uniref:flagellar filament capping protein FliD n=1 Tax=Paenibacillus sp. FSL R7-0163 TaxID=2954530 RepID=UPI0030DD7FBC